MPDRIDVDALERQARAATYTDGLLELFASIMLFGLAAGWQVAPWMVGIIAAFATVFGWRAVERVREVVTYPRVGYHRQRDDAASPRGMLLFILGAFALMAFVVVLSGGFTDAAQWRRAAPLVSGLTLAAGFWYAGSRSGMLRYRFVAGWSVVSGVLLWWFGSGASYAGIAWHLTALALPLLVIGVWSLVRFVRTHPVKGTPTDG